MKKNNKKGFTLVEIIIVTGLLVVIAGIFSLNMVTTLNKPKTEDNENIYKQIISAAKIYVTSNPEEVERLYSGYGYVDIPIGHLREAGLISENLKDTDTEEKISDDEKVRVKLGINELLNFTFPLPKDTNEDAYTFIAESLNVSYNEKETDETWCKINEEDPYTSNVYNGLILDTSNYDGFKSKMYAMDKKSRLMYKDGKDGYQNELKLTLDSCDVNPSEIGTYTITYKYFDPKLNMEKKVKRTAYVESDDKDVISFTVKLNGETPIIRGTNVDYIPIEITEIYRNGSLTKGKKGERIITLADLSSLGYSIADFRTNNEGAKVATVIRTKKNSDGSLPINQKVNYEIIPNKYSIKYNLGYTLNEDEKKLQDRVTKYNNDIAKLSTKKEIQFQYNRKETEIYSVTDVNSGKEILIPDSKYGSLPIIDRRGYTFAGWFTDTTNCWTTEDKPYTTMTKQTLPQIPPATNERQIENTTTIYLCDQTLTAKWTPAKARVYFDLNGIYGSIQPIQVTYNEKYGSLPTPPERTGYTFDGWFTSKIGGTEITAQTRVDIITNQTLYAHWTAEQYTVSYNTGGSKIITYDSPYGPLMVPNSPHGPSYSYSCKGDCTCENITYYTFEGWTLNGQYINYNTIVKTPDDHYLTAVFTPHSYTVGPYNCSTPPSPPVPNSGNSNTSGEANNSLSSTSSCSPVCNASSPCADSTQCQYDWIQNGCDNRADDSDCQSLHTIADTIRKRFECSGVVTYDLVQGRSYCDSRELSINIPR